MSDKIRDIWDEDKLLSRLRQGDEEAFRVLVRQYQQRLFAIAYGITLEKEDSLEIVQDVFLKLHQKLHTFKGEARLSTWLRRITVNQCLNWQRYWKRRFRWHHQPLEKDDAGDLPHLGTDAFQADKLFQKKELETILWEKLGTLPEDVRAVFVLRELEGLSYDEIAQTLNIRRGTVSSRLFHARRKLRHLLRNYLEEGENP